MKEQASARVVDGDEELLLPPAFTHEGGAADGGIRLFVLLSRQGCLGHGGHIAQQGRIAAQIEVQGFFRRKALGQQAFQQAVGKVDALCRIGPERPVALEKKVGDFNTQAGGGQARQHLLRGQRAPARGQTLIQKERALLQIRFGDALAGVVYILPDMEIPGERRGGFQQGTQGVALAVGV